jgi:hypothetical protein
MRPDLALRLQQEREKRKDPLKTPKDLLKRSLSLEDFVDYAVIGDFAVADIISGKVAESQIPQEVIDAFSEQYPNYGENFTEAVRGLSLHPDRLMGLVNGVRENCSSSTVSIG